MISWSEPSNNGFPITQYLIEISDSLMTTWTPNTLNCDGSSTTIINNKYCIIPMSDLTIPPYSYVFNQLVYVRISAKNAEGFSTPS